MADYTLSRTTTATSATYAVAPATNTLPVSLDASNHICLNLIGLVAVIPVHAEPLDWRWRESPAPTEPVQRV